MEICVHRKSLLRVFLTAIYVGEECLATLNFICISALLCVNASLVLAPGKGNVGDDGFSRERGARGAAERVTSHLWGKGCAMGTQVWSLWLFFSLQFTWFHVFMCISNRGKAKVCMAVENGEKVKANAQELENKSIYLECIILSKSCSFT